MWELGSSMAVRGLHLTGPFLLIYFFLANHLLLYCHQLVIKSIFADGLVLQHSQSHCCLNAPPQFLISCFVSPVSLKLANAGMNKHICVLRWKGLMATLSPVLLLSKSAWKRLDVRIKTSTSMFRMLRNVIKKQPVHTAFWNHGGMSKDQKKAI